MKAENKFTSVENGKLQINTDAIKDMFDQWNKLKRESRRTYNENVSEFFTTIQENSEQLSSVASLFGKNFVFLTKGVPDAFKEVSISNTQISFPKINAKIDFADLKDEFNNNIDFSKIDEYKKLRTTPHGNTWVISGEMFGKTMSDTCQSDAYQFHILSYKESSYDTSDNMGKVLRELGENGIDKEAFVTSIANEIERIVEKFEESFKRGQEYMEAVDNGDIESDIELI